MITSIRKPISSTMLAIVAVIVLSVFTAAVAQADSVAGKSEFNAIGGVGFVGPLATTVVTSVFHPGGPGGIESVDINTTDELVVGSIAAVIDCDSSGEATCAAVSSILTGSDAISLHTSDVTLTVLSHTFGPDLGAGPFDILFGPISGDLEGTFSFTNEITGGLLTGTSELDISGLAAYSCIVPTGLPLPLPQLVPAPVGACIIGAPGAQMLPSFLDVTDSGEFKIGRNKAEGVKSIEGDMVVKATVDASSGFPVVLLSEIQINNAEIKLFNDGKNKNDD